VPRICLVTRRSHARAGLWPRGSWGRWRPPLDAGALTAAHPGGIAPNCNPCRPGQLSRSPLYRLWNPLTNPLDALLPQALPNTRGMAFDILDWDH
jgi:hypothetical protein